MKAARLPVVVALLIAGTLPAAAQSVTLEFKDGGLVKLVTQNAPVSLILAEWARRGKATIVNGERIPGPPITLELVDVPEQQALDILLRSASGYLMAARETPTEGVSRFDRILILPTSRVTTTATVLPPPQQSASPVPVIDDDDDNVPAPTPGQRVLPPQNFPGAQPQNRPPGVVVPPQNLPPGAVPPQNLPPGVRVNIPQQDPNRLPPPSEDPEARPPTPAPGVNNPFGVAPGSATPGVITPAPGPERPRER